MAKAVTLDDMQEKDQFITAAIYGASGSGKTTLAASFPKPLLVFDFDGKLGTIPKEKRGGIHVLPYHYSSPREASSLFLEFRNDWQKVKRNSYTLPTGEKPATVLLDSVTVFDIICLNYFVAEDKKDPEIDRPNIGHYGDQASYYNTFFAGINGFKCNLLMIFHEFYKTDDKGMVEGIQPLVTGTKMLNKIPALFQELWYLRLKGNERSLHYRPFSGAVANSISLKGNGKIVSSYEVGPTYEMIQKERSV